MEARNITIVSTKNQNKVVVNTDATTLRELKAALDAQGIDYSGMTFYEGLSHTELLTDEAILPHDVPYKDTTTNELVFMLTTPNKKIRSGASAMSEARVALYESIEELGLKDACVARYGKNFTQCKNSELMALVEEAQAAASAAPCQAGAALRRLVDTLVKEDFLTDEQANEVLAVLGGEAVPENKSRYSDKEIDEMFEFLD